MTDLNSQVSQLRATLSKMEIALGKVEECIVWTDVKGRIKWCNAALARFLGQPNLLILGAFLVEKLPLWQDGQRLAANCHPVTLALETQQVGKECYEFQRSDQHLILEITWSFVAIAENLTTAEDAASAVLVIRDVTQQRLAEAQLKAANEALEQLIAQRTQELIAANAQLESEARYLQQTLVELRQTQAQLIQAEKMSSLGQLVAGIAHEVNNPVNFVHGNLTHVQEATEGLLSLVNAYQQRYPHPDPAIQAIADEIDLDFLRQDLPKLVGSMQTGTDRIREIVLSLRNFSRMDEAQFKSVDIHEGIESTLLILQHRLGTKADHAKIEVIRDYGNLPLVECYPGQLNQVLMNILANAVDALEEQINSSKAWEMDEMPAQRITIQTSVVDSDWIQIAIANTGPNIPEAVQSRIFNPFFTTKPVGKGTGMGMAISYQIIVEKHGGKLECISTPEQDTTFVIHIPSRQQAGKISASHSGDRPAVERHSTQHSLVAPIEGSKYLQEDGEPRIIEPISIFD
ncbi:MAG: ATP-binding protein [Leptolyngbyaceae cyanobacterium bins.349]|nr:ATP-binding protein [Leptolyngbyaceae cyanobacterium bins.349]